MNWIFVGAGNMASSLIGGLINSGEAASNITVVDPDNSACDKAKERFSVQSNDNLADVLHPLAGQSVGIVLAVKPHIVEPVCKALTTCTPDNPEADKLPLVISVAAGVRASSMAHWLPEKTPLVRCMPNTPALLGLGATALFANQDCKSMHRTAAQKLLDSAGLTQWVEQENDLDAVTAVSGSGPAYFFYLIEHMVSAGTKLGLDESIARDLAIETAFGVKVVPQQLLCRCLMMLEHLTSWKER